jgi:hypothetical protein
MTEEPGRRRPPTTGPRGGKTTVTKSGLARKTFALNLDEVRALRKDAYEQERTETDIVRTALRHYLDIED